MPRTLYLIDAYAQIFRAYYSILGGMRSSVTGEPTQAVFGFTNMMIKLFSKLDPTYVVVATDTFGPTFRDEIYLEYDALRTGHELTVTGTDEMAGIDDSSTPAPVLSAQYNEYKGTRDKTPDDLISQVPRIFEVLNGFGVPIVGEAGIEADDVIATIVHRILSDPAYADVDIRIVSKDKDLEQLICDRVSLYDIHTGITVDEDALMESKGITPDQVIDVLALMGDKVDNVPGIDGIGLKTAAQLVHQFGSIDGILERIGEIKGKRQENLLRGKDILPISRKMVTLKRDATFPFEIEQSRVGQGDIHQLIPVFEQLGFERCQEEARKLAKSWTNTGATKATESNDIPYTEHHVQAEAPTQIAPTGAFEGVPYETASSGKYSAITTHDQLIRLARDLRAHPIIAFDTETTGLDQDASIVGLSFSWLEGAGVYVPVLSPDPAGHLDADTVFSVLKPILEDPSVEKCGHNLKFDAEMLLRNRGKVGSIKLRGVVFDSMLASIMLEPARGAHKLDSLALSELYYRMIPITDLIGSGEDQITMDQVPLPTITTYAAEDTDIALRIYHRLLPRIREAGAESLMRDIESPLTAVLAEMEHNGILCSAEELKQQGKVLEQRVQELKREIFQLVGLDFHLDSTQQLAEVLFDRLGFAVVKKTKTGRSTDVSVLEKLAQQEDRNEPYTAVPRLVMEYRQLSKLISTYLGNLQSSIHPATGRIHTTFHQLYTATGRLASNNPNLQNIPVKSDAGKQIRKAFHAPQGHLLICADYSQVELRVLAHFSEDAALLDAFHNDQDIHASVASQVFGVPLDAVTREQRSRAKTVNFGIIYGITPFGLSRRIEGLDVGSATRLINDYKLRFPGIDTFLQTCIEEALSTGKVRTISGRTRAIPEISSSNKMQRSLGERLAINTVIQGSAADLIKVAMVQVQNRIERDNLPLKLLLQIHDELVLEAPEAQATELAAIVVEEMESAMQLKAPLKADAGIGFDWLSAK